MLKTAAAKPSTRKREIKRSGAIPSKSKRVLKLPIHSAGSTEDTHWKLIHEKARITLWYSSGSATA